MRLTDLELYRWKFHHDVYIHTTNKYRPGNYPSSTWYMYWKEYGAFVSVLPRQVGKTRMIETLLNHVIGEQEDYRIICAQRVVRLGFCQRGFSKNKVLDAKWITKGANHKLTNIDHQDINLFVDEFEYIDTKNHLCHILNYPWKSVTMVSSL